MVTSYLLTVKKHLRSTLGAGLIGIMKPTGWQIKTTMKSTIGRSHTVIKSNVPLSCHTREVAGR